MSRLSDALRTANVGGLSARAVAKQARAAGFTLNHDTAARYLRGDHGRPDEDTLRAFSAVLSIELAELRRAAELPDEDTTAYIPPPESSRLTRRQRRAVDEIIRSMLEPAATTEPEHRAGRRYRPNTAQAARRGGAEPLER